MLDGDSLELETSSIVQRQLLNWGALELSVLLLFYVNIWTQQDDSKYVYWDTAVRINTYKSTVNGNKERGTTYS